MHLPDGFVVIFEQIEIFLKASDYTIVDRKLTDDFLGATTTETGKCTAHFLSTSLWVAATDFYTQHTLGRHISNALLHILGPEKILFEEVHFSRMQKVALIPE